MLRGLLKRVGNVLQGRRIDENLLEELEEALIAADVSIDTMERLLTALRRTVRERGLTDSEELREELRTLVERLLETGSLDPLAVTAGGDPPPFPSRRLLPWRRASMETESAAPVEAAAAPRPLCVWMIIGVNGAGKTTSVGKLAHWAIRQGYAPLLAAADTFRAAATEQLQLWGTRVQAPVIVQQSGADPAAVTFDALQAARARGRDLVLIDTAGRLHTKHNLLEELRKIVRVIERETSRPPEETLLVIDGSTGQNGLAQATAFAAAVPLTGIILTKLDGTAKGGIVLTIRDQLRVPIKFIGTGEQLDDLKPFEAAEFAAWLFERDDPANENGRENSA